MRKGLVTSSLLVLLTACSLLPPEEEPLVPAMISGDESATYSVFRVTRGDLRKYVSLRADYVPTAAQTLSFSVGGLYYANLYFDVGDEVKAGDVMAELDTSDLDKPLEELNREIAKNSVEIENREALYAIDSEIESLSIISGQAVSVYSSRIEDLRDQAKTLDLRLKRLEAQRALRFLTAGLDGVVTYVQSVKPGDRSEEGSGVYVITDKTRSVFKATGADIEYLKLGMEVNVVSEKETYRARAEEYEALGIFEPEADAVYLELLDEAVIKDGAYGTIDLMAGERKDVLYIPVSAIMTVRGEKYVYLLENNIRKTRGVLTGFETSEYAEITSGLSEGEEVFSEGAKS
jgi:RND family efflux transporter MFP subunit